MTESMTNLLNQAAPDEQCLASTVLVLTEIAHADKAFDGAERDTISATLSELFSADVDRIDTLMTTALETRVHGTDLTQLARILKQRLSQRDRHSVVEAMWKVAMADGSVDAMEQRLADSMSTLLGISYSEVADIRAAL